MESRFTIYATEHVHSRTICESLAQGTKFPIVSVRGTPVPLRDGGAIFYGFLRGLLPMLQQARQEGRAWAYVDRGYFRATYGTDYSGHFRVTRSAFQHDGRGSYDSSRWARLSLRMHPWRRRGSHILVCPPGEVFCSSIGGFSAKEWLDQTLASLRAHTDRTIRIRHKPAPGLGKPLIDDLQDCHALVTYMSNTAVEAVLAGVPVFCTGRCAALTMGKSRLEEIETPAYPDREQWAHALAWNQWTLEELRTGKSNHLFLGGAGNG